MHFFREPIRQRQGLLKLPAEILQIIFGYAITEDQAISVQQDFEDYFHIFYKKRNLAVRGLGLSCLQVYLDITRDHLFYANNEFKFKDTETAICWLHRRTKEEQKALRFLSLPFGSSWSSVDASQMLSELPSLTTLTLDISPFISAHCVSKINSLAPNAPTVLTLQDFNCAPGYHQLMTISVLKTVKLSLEIFYEDRTSYVWKNLFGRYKSWAYNLGVRTGDGTDILLDMQGMWLLERTFDVQVTLLQERLQHLFNITRREREKEALFEGGEDLFAKGLFSTLRMARCGILRL
jgi:hypothetical protein